MISFLFVTLPFFQNGEVKIKNLKKNGKAKNKNETIMSPPLDLRRLMDPSAEEVGLILPVFLRKLLNTEMPCD